MMDNSKAIKRTGELLLQGWKLLNILCPVCNSALLSKKDDMFCAGCELTVMLESDSRCSNFKDAAVDGIKSVIENDYFTDESDDYFLEDAPFKSLEEVKKEYDKHRGKKNEISAKIGEYMLKGWALLAEECPNESCGRTPLMSLRGGPLLCIACQQNFQKNESGDTLLVDSGASTSRGITNNTSKLETENLQSPPPPPILTSIPSITSVISAEEKVATPTKITSVYDAPILDAYDDDGDIDDSDGDLQDTSQAISDKLLRGWAMLEASCNIHGDTPIMRSRTGERVCVKCEYLAKMNNNKFVDTNKISPTTVQQLLPLPIQATSQSTSSLSTSISKNSQQHDKTIVVLVQKLASLSKLLEDTSDLVKIGVIATSIRQIAEAEEAVLRVRATYLNQS